MPRKKKTDAAPAAQKEETVAAADAAAPVDAAPEDAPAGDAPVAVDIDRVVVFRMDEQRYALPIDVVQEIQQIVALSELPDSSPAVVGVINLRGAVVPAVDLRRLVGVPSKEFDLQTPMIIARTGQGPVALIADSVEDVLDVPPGAIQAPSRVYQLADRLLGVCRLAGELVFIFDIDTLIPADATAGRW